MKTISSHKIAKITLIAFYLMQLLFSLTASYKDMTWRLFGIVGLFLGTTLILIPALIAYQIKKYMACTAACFALLPFVIWANYHEFVLPYRGGGASMAYVVVFFLGMPLSILLALIFSFFDKKMAKQRFVEN